MDPSLSVQEHLPKLQYRIRPTNGAAASQSESHKLLNDTHWSQPTPDCGGLTLPPLL